MKVKNDLSNWVSSLKQEDVNEGKTVSYRTVALKSKEIDPDGKGIHQNTITNNKELHVYFLQYSTTKAYKTRKKSNKPLLGDLKVLPDLVELIVRMEQYISHQNQIWLKQEFEKFQ
jgi:hypothetical protein